MRIGAVLADVQADFPDVTISKIRFLEAQRLLAPQRTPSGYRDYTVADVERLRYILTAQRDWFWPLKVIAEALDAMDRGLQAPTGDQPTPPEPGSSGPVPVVEVGERPHVPTVPGDARLPSTAALREPPRLRLTGAELASAAGLDGPTFEALSTFGLIAPDAQGHFTEDALVIARAAGALAVHGVEPRHLRPFRTAADREIGLVEQIVGPVRSAAARRTAGSSGSAGAAGEHPDPAELSAELLGQCIALHTALVRSALHPAASAGLERGR